MLVVLGLALRLVLLGLWPLECWSSGGSDGTLPCEGVRVGGVVESAKQSEPQAQANAPMTAMMMAMMTPIDMTPISIVSTFLTDVVSAVPSYCVYVACPCSGLHVVRRCCVGSSKLCVYVARRCSVGSSKLCVYVAR